MGLGALVEAKSLNPGSRYKLPPDEHFNIIIMDIGVRSSWGWVAVCVEPHLFAQRNLTHKPL